MRHFIHGALALATLALAAPASAQIVFYENSDFGGRTFSSAEAVGNFARIGFNDRASSVVVQRGKWQVCDDAGFAGRCVVLGAGEYRSLSAMGLNDRVSSAREVDSDGRGDDHRAGGDYGYGRDHGPDHDHDHDHGNNPPQAYMPPPEGLPEYRRRDHERVYEARVTSVRAVVGTPAQRCWVEREQVNESRDNRVPGAIAGALIGGILGHQVGGGSGKDLATVGGVVAGAAIGAHVGGNSGDDHDGPPRAVRRCSGEPGPGHPDYWDVTYRWRGVEHHVQTTEAPGNTITVNRRGEPRS